MRLGISLAGPSLCPVDPRLGSVYALQITPQGKPAHWSWCKSTAVSFGFWKGQMKWKHLPILIIASLMFIYSFEVHSVYSNIHNKCIIRWARGNSLGNPWSLHILITNISLASISWLSMGPSIPDFSGTQPSESGPYSLTKFTAAIAIILLQLRTIWTIMTD